MLMIETVLLTSSFCMSSGGSSTKSYKNILLFIILGTPLKIDIGGEGGQRDLVTNLKKCLYFAISTHFRYFQSMSNYFKGIS